MPTLRIHNAPETLFAYEGLCRPLRQESKPDGDQVLIQTDHEAPMLFGGIDIHGAEGGRWLADNDGKGFTQADSPIDFPLQACRSRIRHIRELAQRLASESMPPSARVQEELSQAQDALDAGHVSQALDKAFWAGEHLVEDEADWRLRSPCPLTLGINTKGLHNAPQAWQNHFAERFDYATVPLTWGIIEVEKGNPRYDCIEELIVWCKQHGMPVKGHALIWHSGFEKRTWMKDLSAEEVLDLSARRVEEILKRFGNDLDAVELVNEPMQSNNLGLTREQELREVQRAYELIQQIAPHLRVMISFYGEDEWWAAGKLADNPDLTPISGFIDDCMERGVKVDLIGAQYHFPDNYFNVRQTLEYWHQRYKIPVHLTELTPSSGAKPSKVIDFRPMEPFFKTWRGRPWDEKIQAEYVRDWLRMFRAWPFLENATFWATTDAPVLWHDYLLGTPCELYRLPWAPGQGLLREDLSPKPALAEVR